MHMMVFAQHISGSISLQRFHPSTMDFHRRLFEWIEECSCGILKTVSCLHLNDLNKSSNSVWMNISTIAKIGDLFALREPELPPSSSESHRMLALYSWTSGSVKITPDQSSRQRQKCRLDQVSSCIFTAAWQWFMMTGLSSCRIAMFGIVTVGWMDQSSKSEL
jgi:hypothetical protein